MRNSTGGSFLAFIFGCDDLKSAYFCSASSSVRPSKVCLMNHSDAEILRVDYANAAPIRYGALRSMAAAARSPVEGKPVRAHDRARFRRGRGAGARIEQASGAGPSILGSDS